MTSYEFEKIAKNAVIDILKKDHGIEVSLEELQFVWFSHLLGAKKCTLYSPKMGKLYAEVTYNIQKNQVYVDMYTKVSNTLIESKDFNLEVRS